MSRIYCTITCVLLCITQSVAQNSFPSTGNVLIGTSIDDSHNSLQVNGGILLGSLDHNGDISLVSTETDSLGERLTDFSSSSIGVVRGGDLMLNNFWGVAININKGLFGDNNNAAYSVVPNSSSFTVNSFSSVHKLTTLFTIRSNGNVGIGTTDPQSALAVNGTVAAQKVKVILTGWPDFVFDSQYPLPSLSSLHTYITQHQHLPDIPTAAEIDQAGLDMGEMQRLQMKKVEELTLYLIEMNKKISDLESQVQHLTDSNKALKEKLDNLDDTE